MLHRFRAHNLLSALAVAALALCVPSFTADLFAADKKATPPPPAKPASSSAKPASNGTAKPGTSGAHPGSTTTSHGPTTSGPSTHGPTTSGPTTSGPRPGGTTTGPRPVATPRAPVAGNSPMARPAPVGSRDIHVAGGGAVRMRANGRPADFHDPRRGMDIHNNLAGGRTISVERADHSRLVYSPGRRGYISHPYMYHGHEFSRRAYYYNGRYYNRFYSSWGYRGYHLQVYSPWRYYPAGFYGWAYNPWYHPVVWGWGWGPSPWYGYYGGYFAPYPAYASPALWLTDYTIAASLQSSYDAAAASGPPPPLGADAAPVGPDVKQMVADEVQRQLALENSEAQLNAQGQPPDPNSSSISRMIIDGQPHAFIAGAEVDVVDSTGQECALTDGDVLQLAVPQPQDATSAQLMVMSSKGGNDCKKMAVVSVPLDSLQEMQNHMRETMDQGLAELQAKQGTGGLPAAPPSATAPPVTAVAAADAPAPDPAGAQELAAQAQQADQAQQELTAQAAAAPGGGMDGPQAPQGSAPPTVSVAVGQSFTDVISALGQPSRIVNLGAKIVYVYPGAQVTFVDGKVSVIQ